MRGGSYQPSGLSIDGFGLLIATFGGLISAVLVQIADIVEVANVARGLDLALDVFRPPSVGTGSANQSLVNGGSGLVGAVAAPGEAAWRSLPSRWGTCRSRRH